MPSGKRVTGPGLKKTGNITCSKLNMLSKQKRTRSKTKKRETASCICSKEAAEKTRLSGTDDNVSLQINNGINVNDYVAIDYDNAVYSWKVSAKVKGGSYKVPVMIPAGKH